MMTPGFCLPKVTRQPFALPDTPDTTQPDIEPDTQPDTIPDGPTRRVVMKPRLRIPLEAKNAVRTNLFGN